MQYLKFNVADGVFINFTVHNLVGYFLFSIVAFLLFYVIDIAVTSSLCAELMSFGAHSAPKTSQVIKHEESVT